MAGTEDLHIRSATGADAEAVRNVYAPIVTDTVISFEYEPPTVEEMTRRVETTLRGLPWLVAEIDEAVVGYAYAGRHRARAAYAWSAETSVYVGDGWRGRGVGRALYEALLDDVSDRGFVNAYAGITLPNEASVALHERVGFRKIGVFPAVGYKFERWHDVGWWHRPLRDPPSPSELPEPPGA